MPGGNCICWVDNFFCYIFKIFFFCCPMPGGCPSPRACGAYPLAGPDSMEDGRHGDKWTGLIRFGSFDTITTSFEWFQNLWKVPNFFLFFLEWETYLISNAHLQLLYGMRFDLRVDVTHKCWIWIWNYMGIWKLQRVVCEEFQLQTKFGCYYISHLEGAKL